MTDVGVEPQATQTACEQWPYTPSCDLSGFTPEQVAQAEEIAQTLLWAASGRRYGVCAWVEELRSCCCICPIGCCDACRLTLSKGPLVAVSSVVLPGQPTPLDPSAYEVRWGKLIRVDGYHWPTYADCVSDGLVISYTAGIVPPAAAQAAMGELVCELTKAAGGDPTCRLPANVSAITRQGVSIEFDRAKSILASASNLPYVSSFVSLTNPRGYSVPSKVTSPDADCVERTVVAGTVV